MIELHRTPPLHTQFLFLVLGKNLFFLPFMPFLMNGFRLLTFLLRVIRVHQIFNSFSKSQNIAEINAPIPAHFALILSGDISRCISFVSH